MQVEQPGAAAGEQQQYTDGMMGDEDMEVSRQKQDTVGIKIFGFSHDSMVGCVYHGQSNLILTFKILSAIFTGCTSVPVHRNFAGTWNCCQRH